MILPGLRQSGTRRERERMMRASQHRESSEHGDPRGNRTEDAASAEDIEAAITACQDEDDALAQVYEPHHPTREALRLAIRVMERMRR